MKPGKGEVVVMWRKSFVTSTKRWTIVLENGQQREKEIWERKKNVIMWKAGRSVCVCFRENKRDVRPNGQRKSVRCVIDDAAGPDDGQTTTGCLKRRNTRIGMKFVVRRLEQFSCFFYRQTLLLLKNAIVVLFYILFSFQTDTHTHTYINRVEKEI